MAPSRQPKFHAPSAADKLLAILVYHSLKCKQSCQIHQEKDRIYQEG